MAPGGGRGWRALIGSEILQRHHRFILCSFQFVRFWDLRDLEPERLHSVEHHGRDPSAGRGRAAPSARPTSARPLKPRASSSGNAHARLGRVDVRARATSTTDASQASVTAAKRALYDAMEGTYRGAGASASERAAVEEAQVALETLDVAGAADIDLELLSGKWRLVYTTAADVLSVLRIQRDLGPLSPVEVGDIFQSFTADGRIENEIRLSVPLLLAPATKARLAVSRSRLTPTTQSAARRRCR